MSHIIYFAYGSNMSHRRIRARVPSAEFLGIGILDSHALAFHKVGRLDGSGKCDIVRAENGTVYGALFKISATELPVLDTHEGEGNGYERRTLDVRNHSGLKVEAWAYVATRTDPDLRPFIWYKRHVLAGAIDAQLPADYLRLIETVEAIEDPDPERAARELAIYA